MPNGLEHRLHSTQPASRPNKKQVAEKRVRSARCGRNGYSAFSDNRRRNDWRQIAGLVSGDGPGDHPQSISRMRVRIML